MTATFRNKKRDRLIVARWDDGQTLGQLARDFGVSRSRVHQICGPRLKKKGENRPESHVSEGLHTKDQALRNQSTDGEEVEVFMVS